MGKPFTQNCLGLYDNGSLIGNNPLETFINYKLLNCSNLKFDCDSSSVVKENLEFLFGGGETTYTDTLISPQSFFTIYLRYYHEDILINDKKSKKLIVPNISMIKNEMISKGISEKSKISNSAIWSFYIKEQGIEVHESMLEFLDSVYYLSNFSSVCRGFNLGRVAKTADNFFLALDKIHLFFRYKNNGASDLELSEILSSFLSEAKVYGKVYLTEKEVITEVMNWLNSFGSYKEFIEKYCFQSFLEDPYDSNSKPKELWTGLFDGTKLQPSKEEFISCIEFMTNVIKERGVKMCGIFESKNK